MIALNNIGFEFGGRYLYRNANWHIKPNQRIGLIGMNGTGKSTLLRVINGEFQLSEGSISKPRDLTIGFLNQDQLSFDTSESIINVAMMAFSRELEVEKEIEKVLVELETDHSEEVLHRLSDLQHEFDVLDGYNILHKCEKVLEGLGFTTEQLKQPYRKFSGGWRMRVILARLLLQKPNLLMLDEPTNHLDLPTIEWLENYLQSYEGTVIVVSHDKEFLSKMTDTTVEISMGKITVYSGNYAYYLESKEERMDMQQRKFDNQQQFIKEQEKFINRFKAKASKATAAQSRVKMLDKLDRIEAPEDDNREINIQFHMSTTSGKVVAELNDVSKKFPDIEIVKNASGVIHRGDKIALIGANGKGKSTLLRMIAGVEPHDGEIKIGYNVINAFYAQHQLESLNTNNEVLEELQQNSGGRNDTELRTILGCFLFAGDDVFKKIKVLSGGEKARVALAKTLLLEANFMSLDEPTNHLDMRSINILIQALQQYTGTFIVVSHDRFFISEIANKIWWIEDKQLKEYPGTYAEYEHWKKKQDELKLAQQNNSSKKTSAPEKKVEKKVEAPKVSSNKKQKVQQQFEKTEQEIEVLKNAIQKSEDDFAANQNSMNKEDFASFQNNYTSLKNNLVILEKEYETLFNEIMELE